MGEKVYLTNKGKTEFKDKYNGKNYIIPPGKSAIVPDFVAYHFAGDPNILNGDDELAAAAERKRIFMRYGCVVKEENAKPLAIEKIRNQKIPKLEIVNFEEEEETVIVDLEKEIQIEPQEEEFASLKNEVK